MAETNTINIDQFLLKFPGRALIDVRSPGEFEQGHIPGALNIPLFSNEERAQVGRLYKQKGRGPAVMKGLKIVGPKMAGYVSQAQRHLVQKELFIHCWRGGMRSESMAWLFNKTGFKCTVLEGGYRAYRRYLREQLNAPGKYIVLGGMTGSGKTKILKILEKTDEQVLDLEGLANHKGSAFGGIGSEKQPTSEQFENNLFEKFRYFDKSKPIWLEDESKPIGRVQIPDELYKKIRSARVIELITDPEYRVERLYKEYANLNATHLKEAVLRISKRLGGLNTKLCLNAIDDKDFKTAIRIVLNYYDKTYKKGLSTRKPDQILKIHLDTGNIISFLPELIQFAHNNFNY